MYIFLKQNDHHCIELTPFFRMWTLKRRRHFQRSVGLGAMDDPTQSGSVQKNYGIRSDRPSMFQQLQRLHHRKEKKAKFIYFERCKRLTDSIF